MEIFFHRYDNHVRFTNDGNEQYKIRTSIMLKTLVSIHYITIKL